MNLFKSIDPIDANDPGDGSDDDEAALRRLRRKVFLKTIEWALTVFVCGLWLAIVALAAVGLMNGRILPALPDHVVIWAAAGALIVPVLAGLAAGWIVVSPRVTLSTVWPVALTVMISSVAATACFMLTAWW